MIEGMTDQRQERFAQFCKSRKIAEDKIRWRMVGDKSVKISVDNNDLKDGGWNFVSMALAFALKELNIDVDVTLRGSESGVDIIVEK
jgi:hypothetical protein